MTFLHAPLTDDAENHRKALASWTAEAQPRTNYAFDVKGNRVYYNECIAPHVVPIMRDMGFAGWGFTLWRYSAHTLVDPAFRTDLYFIPINILSGQPQIIQNGRQHMVVPGWYIVTLGSFETAPEFDCLLIGDIPKGQETRVFNCV